MAEVNPNFFGIDSHNIMKLNFLMSQMNFQMGVDLSQSDFVSGSIDLLETEIEGKLYMNTRKSCLRCICVLCLYFYCCLFLFICKVLKYVILNDLSFWRLRSPRRVQIRVTLPNLSKFCNLKMGLFQAGCP